MIHVKFYHSQLPSPLSIKRPMRSEAMKFVYTGNFLHQKIFLCIFLHKSRVSRQKLLIFQKFLNIDFKILQNFLNIVGSAEKYLKNDTTFIELS